MHQKGSFFGLLKAIFELFWSKSVHRGRKSFQMSVIPELAYIQKSSCELLFFAAPPIESPLNFCRGISIAGDRFEIRPGFFFRHKSEAQRGIEPPLQVVFESKTWVFARSPWVFEDFPWVFEGFIPVFAGFWFDLKFFCEKSGAFDHWNALFSTKWLTTFWGFWPFRSISFSYNFCQS